MAFTRPATARPPSVCVWLHGASTKRCDHGLPGCCFLSLVLPVLAGGSLHAAGLAGSISTVWHLPAADEPHQAEDVSPGQGLPVDQLQHISGNVKLRPLLPLQSLL